MENFAQPTMYELCLMHARADRAMKSVVSAQLESQVLTLMEWLSLGAISRAPKEGFSMSQVSRMLDVTLPQVTALVTTLIKMKLVKQQILATDRRGRQVIITLRGERMLAKLEERIAHVMRSWSQGIPRDQLEIYVQTVAQLSKQSTLKS